ncbi:MAG: regulatory protein GemA [Syntrophobacterales bacterium]|jgi:hypothetical protein|nr:regulatory protein GemA [Syntrophobacterales bacterium]
MTNAPINKGQIKLIKMLQKERDLSDDAYRQLLADHFGVMSCTKLTMRQARNFIDLLSGKRCWTCAPRPKREKISANVTLLASPDQLHMIEDLRHAHSWAFNSIRYNAWLKKRMKFDKVVTSIQATLVIEGLKAMIKAEKHCVCRYNQEA